MSDLPLSAQLPSISGGGADVANDPPTSKADRQRWVPNSEILGPEVLHLPQAIDDIDQRKASGILDQSEGTLSGLLELVMPLALYHAQSLSALAFLELLDISLPQPSPQDHSVYLVTAPRGRLRHRFVHWSLYSQGYFYHLTATGSDALHYKGAKLGKTLPSNINQKIPLTLKVQNVVNPDDAEYVHRTGGTQRIALQAYHIGYTRFTSDQIRRLATYIIGRMESYNVFDENCHSFACELADRTVMAQRNFSVFVGDMHQIGDWDSTGESGQRRFSKLTGYVLADARKDHLEPRTWDMGWRSRRLRTHLLRTAERITILYRDGEHARGAFDPSGERGYFHYQWHCLLLECAQIREDFKQRRWRKLFYGPYARVALDET